MTEINESASCCGIGEICYLEENKPKEIIEIVLKEAYENGNMPYGMYFFSDISSNSPGTKLARYIKSQKALGTITETKKAYNNNSRNYIKMWIWKPAAIKQLHKWFKKTNKEAYQSMIEDYGN